MNNLTTDLFACVTVGCLSNEEQLVGQVNEYRVLDNGEGMYPIHALIDVLFFSADTAVETLDWLLKNGADVSVKNSRGETPLQMCIRCRQEMEEEISTEPWTASTNEPLIPVYQQLEQILSKAEQGS